MSGDRRPCPFCGRTVSLLETELGRGHGGGPASYSVRCVACNARGPAVNEMATTADAAKVRAIVLWNQRR